MRHETMFSLQDRVVLVTGATGHLGSSISRSIAAAGGMPVVCGRSQERLDELTAEIRAANGEVEQLRFDASDSEACGDAIGRLQASIGKLDGVVNCAHLGRPGTIQSTTEADFNLAHQMHVNGPFFIIKAALPLLIDSARRVDGGASVVNISSMYGVVSPDPSIYGNSGNNNPPYYGAAKAGLIQLSRYLACHLGGYNIRVNSVSPGPFPPVEISKTAPNFHRQLCDKNPLGRIGLAHEVAGPVIFLLSSASSYVTGINLPVDGGWTSW